MTDTRSYVSPKRQAKAEETKLAILEAFRAQLIEPGREQLSPTDAAASAGCSVRTVHGYFPTRESRILGLAELLDTELYPEPLVLPTTADDLPDHYRAIHRTALADPLAKALVVHGGPDWNEVRAQRRAARLQAVRDAVASIGADPDATVTATTMLLTLAGAEISFIMSDDLGVEPEEIPGIISHHVEVIIADLRRGLQTES